MTIIQLVRLIRKRLPLLILFPVIVSLMVFFYIRGKEKTYQSEVTFYTELASGYNLQAGPSSRVDYHATQIAFDNFIGIMSARETIREVSLRLFATHLMMDGPDPRMISPKHFRELHEITPKEVKDLIVRGDMEATLHNLCQYEKPEKENFIYGLLHYEHPHYSIESISEYQARRVSNSDLVRITYESNDPGIARLTLEILATTFIDNYSTIKSDQTKEAVAYFEKRLREVAQQLDEAEDQLLEFNTANNIINYYEQTKFIADQKEKLKVEVQRVSMEYAAAQEAINRLEDQMQSADNIFLSSSTILELRDSLTRINENIALLRMVAHLDDTAAAQTLANYEQQSRNVQQRMELEVDKLHGLQKTKEGANRKEVIRLWLDKVIDFAGTRGSLNVLDERQEEFEERYRTFAPLGARLKRIERKIDISEREYLSILHSLGQARLQQENIKMQSDVRIVGQPFFPLTPMPARLVLIVIAAALSAFLLIFLIVLLVEYYDNTLRDLARTERITGMKVASVMPRLYDGTTTPGWLKALYQRLVEMLIFQMGMPYADDNKDHTPQIILLYSMQPGEGKTTIARKVIERFQKSRQECLFLNYEQQIEGNHVAEMPEVERIYEEKKYFELFTKASFINEVTKGMEQMPLVIIVELPPLLTRDFSVALLRIADNACLVANAGRRWSDADDRAQKSIRPLLKNKPVVMLNYVAHENMDSIVGRSGGKQSIWKRMQKKWKR